MEQPDVLMHRVLELAKEGEGNVNPNPMVGALLVKDGEIISEGAHRLYGEAHAEVDALNRVTESPVGSTLYVNLEPCTYDGKTPPCVPTIIQSGVSKIVIANRDPNPKVNGEGIRKLKEAGLEVEVGVLAQEGFELNRGFMKTMQSGLPWVTLKLATTIDGYIADVSGESTWITNEESRRQVHQWRAEHNAVLVGAGTVLTDDPALTVRAVDGANPKRVIIAGERKLPQNAQVLTDSKAPTLVVQSENSKNGNIQISEHVQNLYFPLDTHDQINLDEILRTLYQSHGILSVFVEGGAQIASLLLESDLVDELIIMTGPKVIGKGISPFHNLKRSIGDAIRWQIFEVRQFQNDVCVRYRKENC